MTWLPCVALLACVAAVSQAFPYGAPPAACVSMLPGHRGPDGTGLAPQSKPPPFEIVTSTDNYKAEDKLSVTIRATGDLKFRGFLLQARRIEPDRNQEQPVGFFASNASKGTKVICRSAYGNALTHIGGNPGSDQDKEELTVVWTSTKPPQGHIQFRATIVVDHETYWVAERSSFIRDRESGPLPTSTIPPPPPPMLMLPIDLSSCGREKGCYRNPPNCPEKACDMVVTWTDLRDTVLFELSGDANGWVAVAFSKDKRMGDDDVIECVYNESRGTVEVQQSYNKDGAKSNTVLNNHHIGLSKWVGQRSSGRIACTFHHTKSRSVSPDLVDLNKAYHIFLAKGDATPDGKKLRHALEPGKYPWITPNKVSVNKNEDVTHTAKYALVKLHGCLMLIAWMMCASTAVLMAKYYKPMWPNDKLCGQRVWFAVHRGCLITTLVCTVLGFILIFIHRMGYSSMPDLPDKAHPPLGITVTILCIINPLIALCRPRPKSKWRPVFNWIHWFFGLVAIVLATPTLFIGLNLHKAFVPWWATWVMVAFMLFHLIIELMLEIHGCLNSRKQESRSEEFELRKKSDPRGEYYGLEPEPVGTRFKKTILSIYLFVVIILGLVMIIAVAAG